jgi:hypothetical protein
VTVKPSAKQTAKRERLADLVFKWKTMPASVKLEWQEKGRAAGKSGYHYFLSVGMKQPLTSTHPIKTNTHSSGYVSKPKIKHSFALAQMLFTPTLISVLSVGNPREKPK